MLQIASEIIICLLIAALIGFIIGFIVAKMITKKSITDTQKPHDDSPQEQTIISNPPELLSSPSDKEKDNLTLIKGIGTKIETALNNIGIYHFDQIASWNKENAVWIDTVLGFPGRVEREEWTTQAQLLSSGEETEFSKRVKEGKVLSSKQS